MTEASGPMLSDATIALLLICGLAVLFVWGRWRYDVVAFAGLIAAVALGLVPAAETFRGFSHPATVTVAIVLIVSRGLSLSGAADYLARKVMGLVSGTISHIAVLAGLAGSLSAFMNNVGALALLMPVAMQSATKVKRPVSRVLMPLSFASILGGLATLIGTPPNIIIAGYRESAMGEAFTMFDFTPAGGVIAVVGVLFVTLIGRRLIPNRDAGDNDLFHVAEYVSELKVGKDSPAVGKTLREIENDLTKGIDALVIGVVRKGHATAAIRPQTKINSGDGLIVEAHPDELSSFIDKLDLTISGARDSHEGMPELEDVVLAEAVVSGGARIEGRTVEQMRFRRVYGVNLLAVSRQGRPIRGRMRDFRFHVGDMLLLQGEAEHLPDVIKRLGCWPLAERDLAFGSKRKAGLAVGVFGLALAAVALLGVPIAIALGAAALAMVLFGVLPVRELYDGVDWPVIVLLGALIPVGGALSDSGATALLAKGLVTGLDGLPAWLLMLLILVITMTLSDILNNAATAVVMAPISVDVAARLGVSADPFLMAVAVGASCAFLTPIGHQNNALVMGPGGYAFGDYWRMGLPLEILIVAVGVPSILLFWPL